MEQSTLTNQRKLKILWSSNAPFTPTGYGTATNAIAYRLLAKGYDIRVAGNYGLLGSTLNFNGLPIYPHLFGEFGDDALELIHQAWHPDVLVTLYDIWVGARGKLGTDWFTKLNPHWIAWIPIDSDPVCDPVANQAKLVWKPVAMSKFGQLELKRLGKQYNLPNLKSTFYIPHGAETKQMCPMDKTEAKLFIQKHAGYCDPTYKTDITAESFIVGTNSANKDPMRKDWHRMMRAFAIFLEQEPDAKKDAIFYAHTWMNFPAGFDLHHLAHRMGIHKNVRYTLMYDMYCALPPQNMMKLYNSWDVNMLLSRGEGFGIPIIEAASCGVPTIATDWTSMPELVGDHGWLIPPYAREQTCPKCGERFQYHDGCKVYNHLLSDQAVPDEWKAAEALADAYNHADKVKQFGVKCREDAVANYDYETVIAPKWYDVMEEAASELGMIGVAVNKQQQYDDLFKKLTMTSNDGKR